MEGWVSRHLVHTEIRLVMELFRNTISTISEIVQMIGSGI